MSTNGLLRDFRTKRSIINFEEFDSEKVLSFIVETSSQDMFKFVKKNRKRIAKASEKSNKEFLAHQDKLWGKCFEASEVMYTLAIEAAELYGQYVENKVCSDQKEPKKFTYLALQHIHGRVCQQFAEVLCLLRGGFADAAHARWRSMYELCCTAEFIKRNGENIAHQVHGSDLKQKTSLMLGLKESQRPINQGL